MLNSRDGTAQRVLGSTPIPKAGASSSMGTENRISIGTHSPTVLAITYLVPLLFIWRVLARNGIEVEMSVSQLLSYTYVNALAADMMIVNTCLSAWDFDTRSMEMFTRPMPVFGQVIARTVGEWVPMLILFSVLLVRADIRAVILYFPNILFLSLHS